MMLRYLFAALCLCLLLASPAAAAGGSGTAADPYIIQTAAELQSIQNNLAAYYQLTADIDLSSVSWTPIGSISAPFSGQLDGNGYTISNLDLSSTTQHAGLFSSLTSGATIKDLTLEDFHIESTEIYCGCLVGSILMSDSVHNTATLQNINMIRCSVTSSKSMIGVLCGLIRYSAVVDILDCTFYQCSAVSTGGYHVGIILGAVYTNSNVEITNCIVTYSYAKGNLFDIGILCGTCNDDCYLIMNNCNVNSCIAESISSACASILCGSCNNAAIVIVKNCIAENSIAKCAGNIAGGFVGGVDSTGSEVDISGCSVKDCTILANSYAGGIVGRLSSVTTGLFDSCSVSGCTILANSYAATICPAFS